VSEAELPVVKLKYLHFCIKRANAEENSYATLTKAFALGSVKEKVFYRLFSLFRKIVLKQKAPLLSGLVKNNLCRSYCMPVYVCQLWYR